DMKYADGLGKANNLEAVFIESSSGLLQENVTSIRIAGSRPPSKNQLLGIQVIKDTLTLSKMNLKEDRLWKFVELRSVAIPT
ncbi:hypothetical protein EDC96DRAFT_418814, partial [Choanephora cucurbitarum]